MFVLFVSTIVLSLLVTPLVLRFAWSVDAVSRPDGARRTHVRPTPELGGLAVLLSLVLATGGGLLLGVAPPMNGPILFGLGASALAYCLLGFADDRLEMSPHAKLVGQVIAAVPVVLAGCYFRSVELLGWNVHLGPFGIPCAICWIVFAVNAMNLIDGMDGQASMLGILIAACVGIIALARGQPVVMLMAMGLIGGLTGFLVYNLPPARIYLGDCGSMLVGFLLAVLSMQVSDMSAGSNVTVLMCLLFVPILDTTFAVIRRTANGTGIMHGDREHIHHRLLDRGWSVWRALGVVGMLATAGGALGVASALLDLHIPIALALCGIATACVTGGYFGREETLAVFNLLRGRRLAMPSSLPRERPVVYRLPDPLLVDSQNPQPLPTSSGRQEEAA